MDTTFSAEDLAFRDQVKEFFNTHFTEDLVARLEDRKTFREAQVDWQKILHKQGWVAPGWPVECGGTGWSPVQHFIYETEACVGRYSGRYTLWFEDGWTGDIQLWQ